MTERRYGEIATQIVRDVAELPDRTSPEDQPDMMLVTSDELTAIVLSSLNQQEGKDSVGGVLRSGSPELRSACNDGKSDGKPTP